MFFSRIMRLFLVVVPLLSFSINARATFRVCDDVVEPVTLDPYQVFTEKSHNIILQMMEGLLRLDPEARIQPALAEKWERIDDLKVRFYLRKNVVFHNGEPFNAAACARVVDGRVPRTSSGDAPGRPAGHFPPAEPASCSERYFST